MFLSSMPPPLDLFVPTSPNISNNIYSDEDSPYLTFLCTPMCMVMHFFIKKH